MAVICLTKLLFKHLKTFLNLIKKLFKSFKGECWTGNNGYDRYGLSDSCYNSTFNFLTSPEKPSQNSWYTGDLSVNFIYKVKKVDQPSTGEEKETIPTSNPETTDDNKEQLTAAPTNPKTTETIGKETTEKLSTGTPIQRRRKYQSRNIQRSRKIRRSPNRKTRITKQKSRDFIQRIRSRNNSGKRYRKKTIPKKPNYLKVKNVLSSF